MQPVQITIRDFPHSSVLEDHIRKKADKLSQYYHHINSCRVVITFSQKHKHQGKLYSVHIDLTVPGKELAVNHKQDEDIYVAIRDAFNALKRQLESYICKRRGDVKTHEIGFKGIVKRLFMDEGYGFIQGFDGNEHYFSAANVSNPSFYQLNVGDVVEFLSEVANDGLQARRVTIEKQNHFLEEE